MRINDFNEKFNTNIEKVNYDTLGGFLLDKFGRIPEDDEEITIEDISFKVLKVENNRIISIEVILKD